MILAYVTRSGFILNKLCAPLKATLNPVITSSNIKSAPYSLQRFLRVIIKSSSAFITPIFPATGSIITPAISLPYFLNSSVICALSLYTPIKVFAILSFGTPSESGTPAVIRPEPASTKKPSKCP